MEILLQDIRYAVRMSVRRPGFTAAVVLTLGLGIGANTAIFSVVNGVLIQPLPFKDANRLVSVQEANPKVFREPVGASLPNFNDWKQHNQVFEHIAAFNGQSLTLTGEDQPVKVTAQSVSSDFFAMLKTEPVLGRTFSEEEDKPRHGKVVILSYGLWQGRYGGDPAILERSLTLDGSLYTIAGVMPAGFRFLRDADLWTPLDVPALLQQMRGARFLQVVARLKPDITLNQARAGMSSLAEQLSAQYPQSNSGWGLSVLPLQEKLVSNVKKGLLVVLAAASLVLLIACANVANLMLTRGATRQKEIAVRVALGASSWRLIRQLLTESTLLALVGGAIALLLALWGIHAVRILSPPNLPRLEEIRIDRTVLGFTLIVSLLTGLIFGLAPARQTARVDLQKTLKDANGASSGTRLMFRGALVAGEIALSLILLVCAGVLGRSLLALVSVDPGFRTKNVITMEISLPQYRYPEEHQVTVFFDQLLEHTENSPGVRSAALTTVIPLSSNESKNTFSIEGRQSTDEDWANFRLISPNYFHTMGIPMLKGRAFETRDTKGAPDVVIVNETLAHRYWPGLDPVGKRILFGDEGSTIVGVAGNIRHSGLDSEPAPEMYMPYSQQPTRRMVLVARTDSDGIALAEPLRALVRSIDKDQAVDSFRTMEEVVSRSVAQPRFLTMLLIVFAILALSLAVIGVYGVMAFSVEQRTREFGIRMALGAGAGNIVGLVMRPATAMALVGVVVGLLGGLAATRAISGLLYGVGPTDPLTFIAISVVLTGVALGACFVPARRATKVDPMVALRYE